jgi:ribonuclease P protein component
VIAGCRLPRATRLNDERRISAFRSAPRQRGRWFAVSRLGNDVGHARLLVRVAKKVVPRAVDRNRIKRGVREAFRHQRANLPASDYLISLVRAYAEPAAMEARRELERLLQSANR